MLPFLYLLVCFATSQLIAQTTYNIATSKSEIIVKGTSTLHDWEMNSKEIQGSMQGSFSADSKQISAARVSSKAQSLLSKDEKKMNQIAHDALKYKEHPTISFALQSFSKLTDSGNDFTGTATGLLTIAGKSVKVNLPISGQIAADGSIVITSTFATKMSTFDVSAPSLMFGAIKAGDKITLNVHLVYTK